MNTTVFLIRHGKTLGHEDLRYKGHIDVPLSEEGYNDCCHLGDYLKKYIESHQKCTSKFNSYFGSPSCINAVYSSDLSRAIRSAEAIGRSFNLAPVSINRLRERHFGNWEGLTFDEIREVEPDAFKLWADDPLNFSPPDGESTLEVYNRVVPVFTELLMKQRGHSFAIVSHGGVNRILLCHILAMPLTNIFMIEQDYSCLNIIFYNDDKPLVKCLNYVCAPL